MNRQQRQTKAQSGAKSCPVMSRRAFHTALRSSVTEDSVRASGLLLKQPARVGKVEFGQIHPNPWSTLLGDFELDGDPLGDRGGEEPHCSDACWALKMATRRQFSFTPKTSMLYFSPC